MIDDRIPGLPPCEVGRQFLGFDEAGNAYVMQWRPPFVGAPGSFACIGFDHRPDDPGTIGPSREIPLVTIIPFESPYDSEDDTYGEPEPPAVPFIFAYAEV